MGKSAMVAFLALAFLAATALAQEEKDDAGLAKTIQNPLASLVSLPMQANYNLGVGEYDRTLFNLNIQPVIPYHPNENWNLISRTILPVNSVPMGETDSVFGIGDASLSLFLSPNNASALTWGVGPAFTLPSASNPEVLGSGKLSLGPTGSYSMGSVSGPWAS